MRLHFCLIALCLVFASSCSPEHASQCDCPDGWVCCEDNNKCAPTLAECKGAVVYDGGVDGAVLDATGADSSSAADASGTDGSPTDRWTADTAAQRDGTNPDPDAAQPDTARGDAAQADAGEAPAQPSDFTATTHGPQSIQLSWIAPTGTLSSYRLARRQSGEQNYTDIATPASDDLSYTDNGLEAFVHYAYRLYALNAVGESPAAEAAARTSAQPQLSWDTAPTLASSCHLSVAGDAVFDSAANASYASASATLGLEADSINADENGFSAQLQSFSTGPFDSSWTVNDSLGGATTLQRELALTFTGTASTTSTLARATLQRGADGMLGRQVLFPSEEAATPGMSQPGCARCGGQRSSLTTGYAHTCAVTNRGEVKCWGRNNRGQLGDGSNSDRYNPTTVCLAGTGHNCGQGQPLMDVVALSAGSSFTCALLADGHVKCWGTNYAGQLGDGTTSNRNRPVDVCISGSGGGCSGGQKLENIVTIAAGNSFACAVTHLGEVFCWGDNDKGVLGNGTYDDRHVAGIVCASGSGSGCAGGSPLANIVAITAGGAAGQGHVCALTISGSVKCWGANTRGYLGDGTNQGDNCSINETVCRPLPRDVCLSGSGPGCAGGSLLTDVVALYSGAYHNVAIMEDGDVLCWGSSSYSNCADGVDSVFDREDYLNPTASCQSGSGVGCQQLTNVISFSGSDNHSCVVLEGGDTKCWGDQFYAQLGNGNYSMEDISLPVPVCQSGSGVNCPVFSNVVAISGRYAHTCTITDQGRIFCWGRNDYGQVGNGTNTGAACTNPLEDICVFNPVEVCASGQGSNCDKFTEAAIRGCGALEVTVP